MKKLIIVFCSVVLVTTTAYAIDVDDINAKLNAVQENLDQFEETKKETFLTMAKQLDDEAMTLSSKWYKMNTLDEMVKLKGNPFASKDFREALSDGNKAILNVWRFRICSYYNKIAHNFISLKMFDEAKEIYRYVITKFDDKTFRECNKEAEFGLEDLRTKK